MDDCISGALSENDGISATDQLKLSLEKGGIPLTMRDCVGKVAEMFDPLGKVTPLIAGMKLDVSLLHRSGLSGDDEILENLRCMGM